MTPEQIAQVLPYAERAAGFIREAALSYLADCYAEEADATRVFYGLMGAIGMYYERTKIVQDALEAGGSEEEVSWLLGHPTGDVAAPWKLEFLERVRKARGNSE